jgi:hypothetical protein
MVVQFQVIQTGTDDSNPPKWVTHPTRVDIVPTLIPVVKLCTPYTCPTLMETQIKVTW